MQSLPSPETLLSFTLASFLIELTPGPNMTYLALVSASDGRRAGFATVAGVALGLAIIGAVAGIGVAEIVQASAPIYEALRWSGVAFLFYLAWEGWTAGTDVVAAGGGITADISSAAWSPIFSTRRRPCSTSRCSRHSSRVAGPPLPRPFRLTAIYVAAATIVHAAIVLLAGSLQPFLVNLPANALPAGSCRCFSRRSPHGSPGRRHARLGPGVGSARQSVDFGLVLCVSQEKLSTFGQIGGADHIVRFFQISVFIVLFLLALPPLPAVTLHR